MKKGPERFTYYIEQLEKLLSDSSQQQDPAFWLYQNNARTPVFMLEGLARLYCELHNKHRFQKLETQFKSLEDALGMIDYYDAFAKQFAADKSVPATILKFAQKRAIEESAKLNSLLVANRWIGPTANRTNKIKKKLANAKWIDEKQEMKAIELYYRANISRINTFAKGYTNGFTELESQVHELRRKLRWLSIFPAALRGCIQLDETPTQDESIARYLTPEIVNSPFNKMPPPSECRYLLMFRRDYFLALSWMIAELGKLKDQGLRTVLLNEAGKKSPADAVNETAILTQATAISKTFFAEKNLDKLIVGVRRVKSPK
jgi:hypothetical protein